MLDIQESEQEAKERSRFKDTEEQLFYLFGFVALVLPFIYRCFAGQDKTTAGWPKSETELYRLL